MMRSNGITILNAASTDATTAKTPWTLSAPTLAGEATCA